MQLIYHFGPVAQRDVEFVGADNLFEDEYGTFYWFQLVADTESFYLQDTCGRMIPFSADQAASFGTAALAVNGFYDALESAQEAFEETMLDVIDELAAIHAEIE